jgi:hypothetical protein
VRAAKLLLIAERIEAEADRVLELEMSLSIVEAELGLRMRRQAS